MKYSFIIIFCAIISLCSCSSGITPEEARDNASVTISDVTYLKNEGIVSFDDYNSAIDNIIAFEQKGFVGKYWWIILYLFLVLVVIGSIEEVTDFEEDEMAKPLTKSKSYWIVGLLGFLGGHYLYLRKCKWIGISTMLLAFLFPLCFYKYFMYFYNLPGLFFPSTFDFEQFEGIGTFYKCQTILYILFVFNIIIGIVFVPYWVYQFNGNYFRKHKDNDAILKGKELEVDKFYNSILLPNIKETSEDANTSIEVANNEDFVVEDENDKEISGFWKNIVTLGNSSKLKSKVQRLRALRYCCEKLSEDLDNLDKDNTVLFSYLKYYRVAAYRNLYLAKELIGVVKDKVSSQEQKLIVDEFPELTKPQNTNPSDVYFNAAQTSFNSDRFFDSVGLSLKSSYDNLSERIGKEKELSKEDFIEAGIEIAIDSLIAGITEVFDMYSRTKENIRDIEIKISEAIDYLRKAYPSINNYKAELIRQSELMFSLYKCNRAFVMAYEPLRQKVFGRPTFSQFIRGINKDQQYFKSNEFRRDLQHLIIVCSKYNRIYNAKTGNDESKIIKPVYQESNQPKEKKETKKTSPSQDVAIGPPQLRQQILDIIRDNVKKNNITESSTIKSLKLDKGYNKRALCIRINDSYGTKMTPELFEQFLQVKDIINYVIKKKK